MQVSLFRVFSAGKSLRKIDKSRHKISSFFPPFSLCLYSDWIAAQWVYAHKYSLPVFHERNWQIYYHTNCGRISWWTLGWNMYFKKWQNLGTSHSHTAPFDSIWLDWPKTSKNWCSGCIVLRDVYNHSSGALISCQVSATKGTAKYTPPPSFCIHR